MESTKVIAKSVKVVKLLSPLPRASRGLITAYLVPVSGSDLPRSPVPVHTRHGLNTLKRSALEERDGVDDLLLIGVESPRMSLEH